MDAGDLELIVLGIVAGATALLLVAERVRVPYPILLMAGGLGLGLIPGLPDVTLPPELVFLVFLPPLLYAAAYFSSLRELRANLRPISILAIGLVLATTLTVAIVGHEVVGLDWPAAFVLGAIVAPTDPIAATAIASRLGAPRRTVVIVEGESLINDATALVAYRVAVGAVTAGTFSLAEAGLEFVGGIAGGAAIGLGVGWLVAHLRRKTEDALTEISLSLATAYFAYLPAELLHVSGVVAAVTAGVYLGWRAPELTEPSARLQANGFWEALVFLINVALFVLIGLQLPVVVDGLEGESASELRPLGDPGQRGGHRHSRRVGVRAPPGCRAVSPGASARETRCPPGGRFSWSPGLACVARSRSPPRSRCRWRPTRARPSPIAT